MPALFRGASSLVIRCFKKVEHCADAVTGAAGPVFIFIAWVLTVTAGASFFDVVVRNQGFWTRLILAPLYILVPLNLYGQYWLVTHASAGFPQIRNETEERWMSHNPRSLLAPERWGWNRTLGGSIYIPPDPRSEGKRVRRCRKCEGPKPERTHHCSVCKRCVLLMDHHCPWINACVGLYNQRHFVLFMIWITLGCWVMMALGYSYFIASLDWTNEAPWNALSPRLMFTLSYILALAIGVCVPVLGGWHIYMVARGETSIEGHDNEYLEKKAKEDGLIYLNPYNLGRRRNLELFFNIGPGGYPAVTLLFPLTVPPYTNGWSWPRRAMPEPEPEPGYTSSASNGKRSPDHSPERAASVNSRPSGEAGLRGDGPGGKYVMGGAEDLTDDEDGGGGWWDGDT